MDHPPHELAELGGIWLARCFALEHEGDPSLPGFPRGAPRRRRELANPSILADEFRANAHSALRYWPEGQEAVDRVVQMLAADEARSACFWQGCWRRPSERW